MIITPITSPADKALSDATVKPKLSPTVLNNGPMVIAAKKP
jgi:hypothetical protein